MPPALAPVRLNTWNESCVETVWRTEAPFLANAIEVDTTPGLAVKAYRS